MAVGHNNNRKIFNTIILFAFCALIILSYQANAFASAAVQAQRQKQARQAQLIRERQLLQQKAQQEVAQAAVSRQVQAAAVQQAKVQVPQAIRSKIAQKAQSNATARAQAIAARSHPTVHVSTPIKPTQAPTEHVPVEDFWKKLDSSSQLWGQVVKPTDKNKIVTHYINFYRSQGISITREPSRYSALIDAMSESNPGMLSNPFPDVLRIVAIMEYDFNNGQDRDLMARQVLGEKAYIANKTRLNSR